MFVHFMPHGRPPSLPSAAPPFRWNSWAPLGLIAWLLLGCAAPSPAPLAGPDPSDPAVRVAPVRHSSSVGTEPSRRPVEPRPWGEQNQRVAPAPRVTE